MKLHAAYWHCIWAHILVCRLLAQAVGSLLVIVRLCLSLLARHVSWKRLLFAGSGAAVCRPLYIAKSYYTMHGFER